METQEQKKIAPRRKALTGIVMSDKMKDTIVVSVDNYKKHPKYQKFIRSSKRFKADDKGNTAKVGDRVVIESCRPISREKSFRLIEIKK